MFFEGFGYGAWGERRFAFWMDGWMDEFHARMLEIWRWDSALWVVIHGREVAHVLYDLLIWGEMRKKYPFVR